MNAWGVSVLMCKQDPNAMVQIERPSRMYQLVAFVV